MLYEASFAGILRILFWILIISFVIRLVARLALPHVIKKAEQQMKDRAASFNRNNQPQRAEGDITIENRSTSSKGKSGGEFVDYVEIKE